MNKLFIKYLIFLTVFGVLLVLFLIFKLHESTITSPVISYTPNPRFVAAIKSIGFPPIKAGNRWIVVTSVSHPTEDVKRLAAIEDWNLVVVADTKTPVDWWLENVHFLSVEYQKQLPFSLVTKLPYKSYTRKNIGYLYAISKGAEWIYDTDDDNKPYDKLITKILDQVSGARFLPQDARELSQRIFNPYRFYGMDGMWPRGFPLEHFEKHTNGNSSQVLCYKMERAAVQQGLVQHDPDVDAIYRLRNADKNSGLNVEFNKFAPPITLSVGTYSPWNSQNTLFHKSAFHTMFLPTTVSFRTTDIWRSFISQKILHLSGLTVSFVPTNAIQFRNAHDYLKDFRDEKRVYEDSGKMIDFFHNWKCDSKTLEDCIHKLLYDLVTADFWLRDDAEMMEMYLDDLKNLGFQFSKLLDYANSPNYSPSQDETTRNVNCRRMHLEFDLLKSKKEEDFSIRKAEQKLKYFGDIVNWCKETGYSDLPNTFPIATQLAKEHDDTYVFQKDLNSVLIAVNNYPWQYGMGLIQRLYQPYFATIIFCGSWYPEKIETVDNMTSVLHPINYIHMNPSEISYGAYAYHCVTLVKEMRLNNVQGYFMMSDDAVFNIWQRVDYSRVHHLTGSLNIYNTYFTGIYGEPAAKKILATVKDSTDLKVLETWKKFDDGLKKYAYNNITDGAEAVLLSTYGKSYSDFYYIPSTEIDYYADLMRLFYDGGLFLETAVDRFIRSINHQTSLAGESSYLWFDDREKWPKLYNKNLVALHPVKPSMFRYPGDARKTYCATVIQSWADIVFDGSRNFTIKDDGAKENYTII